MKKQPQSWEAQNKLLVSLKRVLPYLSLRNGLLAILFYLIFSFYIFPYFATALYSYNRNHMIHDTTPHKQAYFAGGCFWCMEGIFEAQMGVKEAIVWYAGWTAEDATYDKVSMGNTGHREAVEVIYNPKLISYQKLVELYYTQIDPTQADGQFNDRGSQYTTAILYSDDTEKKTAEASQKTLEDSKQFSAPIAVKIEPFRNFFPAEDYHQDYYKKSSLRYHLYKEGSGRARYIEQNWGKKLEELSKDDLRQKLTPIQYQVTQEDGTEPAYHNDFWDNHKEGIYVDIVDGTPLFSSKDKYDSGTGWPSFTKAIDSINIVEKTDTQFFMSRTEVRSKNANSHLGHVFDDGPVDKGGKRYCMNSAALRFIPREDLEKEGYSEYQILFDTK